MYNDTLDILKQYITVGRNNYIKIDARTCKDDMMHHLLQGRIGECNNILAFITEIECPDFTGNSIANIDKINT